MTNTVNYTRNLNCCDKLGFRMWRICFLSCKYREKSQVGSFWMNINFKMLGWLKRPCQSCNRMYTVLLWPKTVLYLTKWNPAKLVQHCGISSPTDSSSSVFFYLNDVSSESAGDNCSNLSASNDFTNFSNVAMVHTLFKRKENAIKNH